jgi:hypothetical protein
MLFQLPFPGRLTLVLGRCGVSPLHMLENLLQVAAIDPCSAPRAFQIWLRIAPLRSDSHERAVLAIQPNHFHFSKTQDGKTARNPAGAARWRRQQAAPRLRSSSYATVLHID